MSDLPRFAVIADAHVYTAPGLQDHYLQAALSQAKEAGAAFAIIAGDLVEHGHVSCYENALPILRHSDIPWYPVIGNKEVSQNSTRRYISYFGKTYYTVEHEGYRLIVLGNVDFNVPLHKLCCLQKLLEQTAPHDNTILVMHHYLAGFAARDRNKLVDICARYGVRHVITAHRHRIETTTYRSVTEHLLQAVDPDKALGTLPGFTLCRLDQGRLRTRFVPMTVPADDVQHHLLDQLGLAPTGAWHPIADMAQLCAQHRLRSYQLRIGAPEGHAALLHEAEVARDCGLQVVGHLPTPQLDEDGKWLDCPHMDAAIELCADVARHAADHDRPSVVVLHPPKLPADLLCDRYGILATDRGVVKRVVEAYAAMVGHMRQRGLVVALENNSSKKARTTFGALPSHLTGLAEALERQGLYTGYCFDVGHAKASVTQAQISQWMAALGDRLLALHLHCGDPHMHTTHRPIQELYSTTRWYGIAAWLAHKRLTAPCLLEVASADAAATSIATLSRLREAVSEAQLGHEEAAPASR